MADPATLRSGALNVPNVSPDVGALVLALVYLGDRIAEASERIAHPMCHVPGHVGPMSPAEEAVAANAQHCHARKER